MDMNERYASAWEGFAPGEWQEEINTRDFIQKNYTLYEGDESFLEGISNKTNTVWKKCLKKAVFLVSLCLSI